MHCYRTREGAHSLPRILHAHGDATGAEISRSLVAFARAHPRIQFAEWTMVTGWLSPVAASPRRSGQRRPLAPIPRLIESAPAPSSSPQGARGRSTLTPPTPLLPPATASLSRSRPARLWPTWSSTSSTPRALALPGVPRFLLSEALRGEGAILRNDRGERFMERYHPLAELAPRDVVARAIAREGMGTNAGETRAVHLDMRHVRNIDLHRRFPCISAFLARYGLDLVRDVIPVRPAAHYLMGGIRTDLDGRTSVRGLYAAGEAACTGVHGANRLASNSLLEGLVFGARAAKAMLADGLPLLTADRPRETHYINGLRRGD